MPAPAPHGEVLVCFAVPPEARPFRRAAPPGVSVLVTGMGARRTRQALEPVLGGSRPLPRSILTCGFAGGLDPRWQAGDVLFEAGPAFPLAARLSQAGARPGRFQGVDRVATTAADKRVLWERTGADAVEMESAVVHELASARGIPCATVRVISDAAGEDLPLDFNEFTGPDGDLSPWRLAAAVALRPWRVPRLIRFGRQTSEAASALGRVLARALGGPGVH